MQKTDKVDIANQVLATFSPRFQAEHDRYLILKWTDGSGNQVARRWLCAPNFYPPFYRLMGCGGTQTQAIEHILLEYGFEGDRLAEFQGRLKVVVAFLLDFGV